METKNKIAVLAMFVGTQTGFDCSSICDKTGQGCSKDKGEKDWEVSESEESICKDGNGVLEDLRTYVKKHQSSLGIDPLEAFGVFMSINASLKKGSNNIEKIIPCKTVNSRIHVKIDKIEGGFKGVFEVGKRSV